MLTLPCGDAASSGSANSAWSQEEGRVNKRRSISTRKMIDDNEDVEEGKSEEEELTRRIDKRGRKTKINEMTLKDNTRHSRTIVDRVEAYRPHKHTSQLQRDSRDKKRKKERKMRESEDEN
jgi:hypothetical protein